MSAWLEQEGLEVPQPGDDPRDFEHSEAGHDDSMMGMLTEQEMTQLARARGSAFDRLFLQGMIRHHRGARRWRRRSWPTALTCWSASRRLMYT